MNEVTVKSLGQDKIRSLLPHAGQMCLLDSVQTWDAESISCVALGHCSADNPLRGENGLSSANGIEYAAQAMALHAALVGSMALTQSPGATGAGVSAGVGPGGTPFSGDAGSAPPHGVLASVRAVQLHQPRLDVCQGPLTVRANLLSGDPRTAIYEFSVLDGAAILLQGRASVMFDARGSMPPKA